mmetsp:Transcript_33849/g.109157  ORF Transcript_33849/g.109157 Transcript_33849/m.109157 type:complete len:421 (-) Transcript_33849:48-1310(-)
MSLACPQSSHWSPPQRRTAETPRRAPHTSGLRSTLRVPASAVQAVQVVGQALRHGDDLQRVWVRRRSAGHAAASDQGELLHGLEEAEAGAEEELLQPRAGAALRAQRRLEHLHLDRLDGSGAEQPPHPVQRAALEPLDVDLHHRHGRREALPAQLPRPEDVVRLPHHHPLRAAKRRAVPPAERLCALARAEDGVAGVAEGGVEEEARVCVAEREGKQYGATPHGGVAQRERADGRREQPQVGRTGLKGDHRRVGRQEQLHRAGAKVRPYVERHSAWARRERADREQGDQVVALEPAPFPHHVVGQQVALWPQAERAVRSSSRRQRQPEPGDGSRRRGDRVAAGKQRGPATGRGGSATQTLRRIDPPGLPRRRLRKHHHRKRLAARRPHLAPPSHCRNSAVVVKQEGENEQNGSEGDEKKC